MHLRVIFHSYYARLFFKNANFAKTLIVGFGQLIQLYILKFKRILRGVIFFSEIRLLSFAFVT